VGKRKEHADWFTTTEAARLCGLSHMTVIRRFDCGDLRGFRVPGSKFRRIPRKSLIEFASRHGIPLADAVVSGDLAGVIGGRSSGGRKVLIVEDDRRMADLMEKIMTADGWQVRVARNGFDAGFMAGTFLPDMILLDIMLPGIDGRQACRMIRENPRLAQIKILAVTALRDQQSIDQIMEAGADGYLAKPFSLQVLRDRVAGMMTADAQPALPPAHPGIGGVRISRDIT